MSFSCPEWPAHVSEHVPGIDQKREASGEPGTVHRPSGDELAAGHEIWVIRSRPENDRSSVQSEISLVRGGSDDNQVQSTPELAATASRVGLPSRLAARSSLARTSRRVALLGR